ncbi:MAG: hypothetical protein ACHQDY_10375, partial [Solirubrobacterales bacterium]
MSHTKIQRGYALFDFLLLGGSIAVAVVLSRSQDWQPIQLFVLLLALSAFADRLTFTVRNQELSAAFIALVLAMTLLGPLPAVLIGMALAVPDAIIRRLPAASWRTNVSTYAVFLVTGALLTKLAVGDVHGHSQLSTIRSMTFGLFVFGVYIVTNLINFALIALHKRVLSGRGLIDQARYLFMPILPGQVAAAALAALLAVAYTNLGYPALLGLVLGILIFQYLLRALVRSEDRAEQLEARSMRLASLQLGVLVTLVETLALRDRMTARHAAAVARYARALAREAG